MLNVEGLAKQYGDVIALNHASFRAERGRVIGFLGPNGAGKTTTMRCIFGLAVPDEGSVTWDGVPLDRTQRLRFGYMPEERGLYPKMNIVEQVQYFGRLSGMTSGAAKKSALYWLERVGLADRTESRLDELSHGNQQRVQLATALVHAPEFAILDEPFAGLDPIGVGVLSELIVELAADGVGILFSSHQLDLVEDICEDVVIIDEGRVVVDGQVDELKAAAELVRIEVSVDGNQWVPSFEGLTEIDRSSRQVRYLADRSLSLDDVLSEAETQGQVTSFSYGPPHLSDLFRMAVNR